MEDRERIALGECRSPLTTEMCPYCIDTCEAMQNKATIREQEIRLQYGKDAKIDWCNICDKETVHLNSSICIKCCGN